jgi:DNA-binding Xre family transcriptional regulator
MATPHRRQLPPGFLDRVRRQRKAILHEEKDELIAKGRRLVAKHERLRDAVDALKVERKIQKVSLTELERRTGISKSSLSRLENDPTANPTMDTLMRIAEALGKQVLIKLAPAALGHGSFHTSRGA